MYDRTNWKHSAKAQHPPDYPTRRARTIRCERGAKRTLAQHQTRRRAVPCLDANAVLGLSQHNSTSEPELPPPWRVGLRHSPIPRQSLETLPLHAAPTGRPPTHSAVTVSTSPKRRIPSARAIMAFGWCERASERSACIVNTRPTSINGHVVDIRS